MNAEMSMRKKRAIGVLQKSAARSCVSRAVGDGAGQ